MANLWDTMSDEQRTTVARAYVSQQGNRSNENFNRAKEQLAANPNLVQRIAKEEGLIDADENTMQEGEGEEENEIEKNVAASLEDVEGDNQATGQNTRAAIPPAEVGESMDDYIKRLSRMKKQPVAVDPSELDESEESGMRG